MSEFDQIELVVTRPIQVEIDGLKGRGNGRQASRARKAASKLNELLSFTGYRNKVRDSEPTVHLRVDLSLRPDDQASGQLDYGQRDDQLVGIVLGFQKAHPDRVAKVLTDDSGPKFSAQTVGVNFQSFPPDWLLPPEEDEATKRARALQAELDIYKSQEPSFKVCIEKPAGGRLDVSISKYEPLTEAQIDELLARLQAKYPVATDFGEVQRMAPEHTGLLDIAEFALPAGGEVRLVKQEDIDYYRKRYGEWIEDCRAKLANLAKALQRRQERPAITVVIENAGSRPAEDALVVAAYEGPLAIGLPKKKDDDEPEKSPYELGIELRSPPLAPKPKAIERAALTMDAAIQQINDLGLNSSEVYSPRVYRPPEPRDPNAVYLKVGSRGVPQERIEYECAQWRHGQRSKSFDFELWYHLDAGVHKGVINFSVHAANLSQPLKTALPVAVTVSSTSCLAYATTMVDAVKDAPRSLRLVLGNSAQ